MLACIFAHLWSTIIQIWWTSHNRGMSWCHDPHVCPEHCWCNHSGWYYYSGISSQTLYHLIVLRLAWQALFLPSSWCQWAGVRPSCSPRLVPPLLHVTLAWILQNALITMRNGALYLLVRLADLRMKHLIECHVNGHFLMKVGQWTHIYVHETWLVILSEHRW